MLTTAASAHVLMVSGDDAGAAAFERQGRRERLSTRRARTAQQALKELRGTTPDAIVLDLGLPDEDGFDTLKRLRALTDAPIVLVSDEDDHLDEVVGLALGADAYVPRGTPPRLFVARVKALLRRLSAPHALERLRLGSLELDPAGIRAMVEGEELPLTLYEFRLLEVLLRASGAALTRRQMLLAVSDVEPTLERTIDVHVSRIRRKLAAHGLGGWLQTVRGVGYRLARPER